MLFNNQMCYLTLASCSKFTRFKNFTFSKSGVKNTPLFHFVIKNTKRSKKIFSSKKFFFDKLIKTI